jgi:hypothetical protein
VKGLLRFALGWVLAALLTPYVNRFFQTLIQRLPEGTFLYEVLDELSDHYASTLVSSLVDSLGEVVLGE